MELIAGVLLYVICFCATYIVFRALFEWMVRQYRVLYGNAPIPKEQVEKLKKKHRARPL